MEYLILVLISIFAITQSTPITTRENLMKQKQQSLCNNILHFNNFHYMISEVRNISGIPADMSIHWKTDNVFFTLISDEMKMNIQLMHEGAEIETIKVAGLGQSTCVDNLNDIVYLATDSGVYKYKYDGSLELYAALGEDVMYVAVTSDGATMYIATWPQNRVVKITNEGQKQETFPAIPNGHGLTIDPRGNIFFSASKTSYILKDRNNVAIKIKGLPNDKMVGVFVSRSDEIFGMDESSKLYSIDPENASAKLLGSFDVEGVNSFAMDSADNVLIGVRGAIIKFHAYEKNPCTSFTRFTTPNKKNKRNSKRRKNKKQRVPSSTTPMTSTTEANEGDDAEE